MPPPLVYEYFLDVEISSEDVETLLDALDDEPFALREVLGAAEVLRPILQGRLIFAECRRRVATFFAHRTSGSLGRVRALRARGRLTQRDLRATTRAPPRGRS